MSALEEVLRRVLDFVAMGHGGVPARRCRIVEVAWDAARDEFGRARVSRQKIFEPGEYEARFDELMSAGMPWINVNCVGDEGGIMIIAIELPRPSATRSRGTSVNISRPMRKVVDGGWAVALALAIE